MASTPGASPSAPPQDRAHQHLRPHNTRHLTQGAIFTCATAENYSDCNVYGLVLTARCDLTQDKAPVTNYVPVVSFNDWLHRDFFGLLVDRCEADTSERFEKFLDNHGLAKTLLIAHTPSQIVDAHFPNGSHDRDVVNARKKGLDIVRRFEALKGVRLASLDKKPVLTLAEDYEGIRGRLIKDCIYQKLFGYYFLPAVSIGGDSQGYVALLREVHHLPSRLAAQIAVGLDSEGYKALQGTQVDSKGPLRIEEGEMSFVAAVMQSPHVEHLLQVFGMLFGRIGLPDPDEEYISQIWARQPSVSKEAK